MIHFYTMHSASPNVRKILIMLAETGLPYSVKRVEKQDDGKFPEGFFAINPNGTVPAIVDHETGNAIFESGAILHYLAEKSGKLLPTDPVTRGEVVKWLMFEAANMGPVMGELFHYLLIDPDTLSDLHLARYKGKVARYCAILNRQLEGREYLCGDYSIADVAIYPWTVILEDMADLNVSDYPRLEQWAARIGSRPAAQIGLGD